MQAVLSDYFSGLQERLTDTIAEGVARGELKAARPSDAAQVALSVLEGALLLSRTHQRSSKVSPAGIVLVTLLEGREESLRDSTH